MCNAARARCWVVAFERTTGETSEGAHLVFPLTKW
jgi:hypothetical protein